MPHPLHSSQKFDAAAVAELRGLLPTTLGSAEIRGAIAGDIRARAVFTARGANLTFLSRLKTIIDRVANGDMDRATARWQLKEILRATGYTPEGGFPSDLSGEVPEAIAGTLQDLSSDQRLNFIIDTQAALMRGRGQQLRGMTPAELETFPAWELVRVADRSAPRRWSAYEDGSPPVHQGQTDERARWTIAGGRQIDGRMIALKGDPIWGELGGSGNFDDALDVDYPPFAFNSGMGWQAVTREECERLHVTGPNGETIDDWLALEHPLLVDTQSGLPAPQLSLRAADPALTSAFLRSTGAVQVETTATPAPNKDALLAQLEARRLAREARQAARLEASIESRNSEYAAR